MNEIFTGIDSISLTFVISLCKLSHSSMRIYLKKYYLTSYKSINH